MYEYSRGEIENFTTPSYCSLQAFSFMAKQKLDAFGHPATDIIIPSLAATQSFQCPQIQDTDYDPGCIAEIPPTETFSVQSVRTVATTIYDTVAVCGVRLADLIFWYVGEMQSFSQSDSLTDRTTHEGTDRLSVLVPFCPWPCTCLFLFLFLSSLDVPLLQGRG